MKTSLVLLFPLLLINCASQPKHDEMTDSERIYETLSTSEEFKDKSILLCIGKDCLTVDRKGLKPDSRHKVFDDDETD